MFGFEIRSGEGLMARQTPDGAAFPGKLVNRSASREQRAPGISVKRYRRNAEQWTRAAGEYFDLAPNAKSPPGNYSGLERAGSLFRNGRFISRPVLRPSLYFSHRG